MTRRALLTLALLAPAGPALAHEPNARGPHGGMIADAGTRHVELVLRDGELRIHVLDDQDRPVPATGASGSAVVQGGSRQQTVRLELAPDGAFLLGRGDWTARGTRVVATLTLPGQPQRSVRFAAAN